MSVFFPLRTFVSKKTIIPVISTNNNDEYQNTQPNRNFTPPKYIKNTQIPLLNKKRHDRSINIDDIFAEAKARDVEIKRNISKQSLYRGMIQRISEPQTNCKKCGMR